MDDSKCVSANEKTKLLLPQKNKRKKWKKAETDLFLKCFLPRRGEFRSRKKIYAFQNVLKDMFEQGFMDTTVTPATLEGKLRTLSIAYDAYKENPFPGSAPINIQPHLKELDIIFGSKSISMEEQSIESADENSTMKSENISSDNELNSFTYSETEDPLNVKQKEMKEQTADNEAITNATTTPTTSQKSLENNLNLTSYDRDCAQQEYYEAKLDYKRRALALKAKFYSDIKDLFTEKFKREEAMEKEKLELLKQIAEKLCKNS